MIHAQYHLLHNPEKRVGLHYSPFRPPENLLPLEIFDEKK
jgi:hypothetical protein